MRLRFDVVDVFTDRPFAGNQLAVVHGAAGLSTDQCLALAREFGFSETTFPDPTAPDEYAVRIFTPSGEIAFAGHPTLGTAWVLQRDGLLSEGALVQVCDAGRIGVRPLEGGGMELSAAPRELVGPLEDGLVAALLDDLGLAAEDGDGQAWVAGCGLDFVHLPVSDDAVRRARLPTRGPGEHPASPRTRDRLEGVNLVAVSGEAPELTVHARVFVPGVSVAEDAATGSAAAGLGMALVASGRLPRGGSFLVEQGLEMGRPSRLHGRVEVDDGRASRCHVAGGVQQVATGEIEVPLS